MHIAVLSYHGWEMAPDRLVGDVRSLRKGGWIDISLSHLKAKLEGDDRTEGRFFHVTSDDGEEQDLKFVEALHSISCPATLFISLGRMEDRAKGVYRKILSTSDFSIRIQDHSLNHQRTFHYRHVVGFHSEGRPLFSSPEALGLKAGEPVCVHGGGLVRPRFIPSQNALSFCREKVESLKEEPGSLAWEKTMANLLVESGYGFYRMGKLCVHGEYEKETSFRERIRKEIEEGRRQLAEFTGKTPIAFAYPWWQKGKFAEKCLRELGYQLTFSGRGMVRKRSPFGIPRIFINDQTPRPLDLKALAAEQARGLGFSGLRNFARNIIYR